MLVDFNVTTTDYKVLQAFPAITVINTYGSTENTTFTCCHPMHSQLTQGNSLPIGRHIANTTVYVLDTELTPVPIGVVGELYTGGDGLAEGYLNRPDLTAERFVPHPFSSEPGARLYRTGDLVRYRPDGALEFLGRRDRQAKPHGLNIEQAVLPTDGMLTIPQRQSDAVVPASFAQQRLWFLEQLEPGTAAYNIPVALRIKGKLDIPALEQSLGEIVRRHEILRTTLSLMSVASLSSMFTMSGLPLSRWSTCAVIQKRNVWPRLPN